MPTKTRSKYPVNWEHSYTGQIINGMNEVKLPPLEILKWMFQYNPETGELFKIRRADGNEVNPPKIIKTIDGGGYIVVSIRDSHGLMKTLKAHRVCWLMYHGIEPDNQIDHKNGIRSDNRISNLRVVDTTTNNRNKKMRSTNTSGATGVCWHKTTNKWMARITINCKLKTIGYFDTIDEAIAVREAAIIEFNRQNPLQQYHQNHGLPVEERSADSTSLTDNVIPFPSTHVSNASNSSYTACRAA